MKICSGFATIGTYFACFQFICSWNLFSYICFRVHCTLLLHFKNLYFFYRSNFLFRVFSKKKVIILCFVLLLLLYLILPVPVYHTYTVYTYTVCSFYLYLIYNISLYIYSTYTEYLYIFQMSSLLILYDHFDLILFPLVK